MLQVRERRAIHLVRVALGLAGLALTASCSTNGLAFRQDTRVDIVAPTDRAEVELPFEVRWTARDLPAGTAFGVLVDRAPPPPGKSLEWIVEEDPGCRAEDGCPNAAYLAERNIFRTTATAHRVERITALGVEGRRERHEVTIILLDRDGHREGESAFSLEFEVKR